MNSRWLHPRAFLSLASAFVFFPLILTGMAYAEFWITGEAGVFNTILFLPLSIYYSLPALIFPNTYFVTGHGVGPTGIIGIGIACFFYAIIAYFISIFSTGK
jgi:hypothetical protein